MSVSFNDYSIQFVRKGSEKCVVLRSFVFLLNTPSHGVQNDSIFLSRVPSELFAQKKRARVRSSVVGHNEFHEFERIYLNLNLLVRGGSEAHDRKMGQRSCSII